MLCEYNNSVLKAEKNEGKKSALVCFTLPLSTEKLAGLTGGGPGGRCRPSAQAAIRPLLSRAVRQRARTHASETLQTARLHCPRSQAMKILKRKPHAYCMHLLQVVAHAR